MIGEACQGRGIVHPPFFPRWTNTFRGPGKEVKRDFFYKALYMLQIYLIATSIVNAPAHPYKKNVVLITVLFWDKTKTCVVHPMLHSFLSRLPLLLICSKSHMAITSAICCHHPVQIKSFKMTIYCLSLPHRCYGH